MSKKEPIEPQIILTVCTTNSLTLPLIITDKDGQIIYDEPIYLEDKKYKVFKRLIDKIDKTIEEYSVDTIILEQNKLFIDKIDKFPDPYVLQDILFRFKLNTLISFIFFDKVKHILEYPERDWKSLVLNKNTRYSIDLYKSHILHKITDIEFKEKCDKHNYYKTLCLSESVNYDSLLNVKYKINKE